MAQKTGKEETEFKVVPETLTMCVNNCGVIGNPATNNMCQNCFNATTSSTSASTASSATSATSIPRKFVKKVSRSGSPRSSLGKTSDPEDKTPDLKETGGDSIVGVVESKEIIKREVNRCLCCRKKVGLTGFRCRCGELFCGEHRYSDRHDCSYDYKTAGREAIARENPVVKAAKILKV